MWGTIYRYDQSLDHNGQLTDPYDEFCVKESTFIHRGIPEVHYTDVYWEGRYTVGFFRVALKFTEKLNLRETTAS
jgi:hypothetical protein